MDPVSNRSSGDDRRTLKRHNMKQSRFLTKKLILGQRLFTPVSYY